MPQGIASSNQLAMMDKVLAAYCEAYNVTDEARREDAATLIIHLFNSGFRNERTLLAELSARRSTSASLPAVEPREQGTANPPLAGS